MIENLSYNTLIGARTADNVLSGAHNTYLGHGVNQNGGENLTHAIAIGSGALVAESRTMVIGNGESGTEIKQLLPGGDNKMKIGSQAKTIVSVSLKNHDDNAAAITAGAEPGDIAMIGGVPTIVIL